MFPAWSRTHACYAAVAPAWLPTRWDNHQRTCLIGPVPIGDRVPTVAVLPILQPIFKCQGGGLGGGPSLHDRCAIFGRGLDSALQDGKDPCSGYCMYKVHGIVLWYMAQRSGERGRGTHIVINPHRRAEVFGALLEIAPGPWPVNVASSSAAKPRPPLQCQPMLAGCFRGGTTNSQPCLFRPLG